MNSLKYCIHVVCLFIIQIAILDNIQISSYIYINLYILAILLLPYGMKKTSVLLLAFFFGLLIDIANNTMGVHAAATTFLAYVRPKLLMLTSNREQMDGMQGTQKVGNLGWFMKYTLLSVFIYNIVFFIVEAFSFSGFGTTLLRIIFSTIASFIFILLYYFIALKKKQD